MTDLNVSSGALMIMDYQTRLIGGFPTIAESGMLSRAAALLAAARAKGLLVIYVMVGFRPGLPEVSANNVLFSAVKASGRFKEADPIHADVAPLPDDIVVTKHRVGAFYGTDLEMILKAQGIDTLVMCGISTSGVVLSTARYGADADYKLVIVNDCCADRDAATHDWLIENVLSRSATIISSDELIAALK
jgi:nicotinamidase-related amidase